MKFANITDGFKSDKLLYFKFRTDPRRQFANLRSLKADWSAPFITDIKVEKY